jgi:hypothetical protein
MEIGHFFCPFLKSGIDFGRKKYANYAQEHNGL